MQQAPTLQDMTRHVHELCRLASSAKLKAGPRLLLQSLLMPWNKKERKVWFSVDAGELGDMCGCSDKTVYRHLGTLEALGLIRWSRGRRGEERGRISLSPLYGDAFPAWVYGDEAAESGDGLVSGVRLVSDYSQTSLSSENSPKAQRERERGNAFSARNENRSGEDAPVLRHAVGEDAVPDGVPDKGATAAGPDEGVPAAVPAMGATPEEAAWQTLVAEYPAARADVSTARTVWLNLLADAEPPDPQAVVESLRAHLAHDWSQKEARFVPKMSNWLSKRGFELVPQAEKPSPAPREGVKKRGATTGAAPKEINHFQPWMR